jgi:hypothetical protein
MKTTTRFYSMSKLSTWFMLATLVLSALLIPSGPTAAGVTEEWAARYNGTANSVDLFAQTTAAQAPGPNDEVAGLPWQGEAGITETVADIMARESQLPRFAVTAPREIKPRLVPHREYLQQNPDAPQVSRWSDELGAALPELAVQPFSPQKVGVSFLGARLAESGYIPPDSMGAVGPTQFLICVNGRIKVFSKTGVLGALNVTTETFFSSVGGAVGTTDPQVRYDRLSGRWFVTMVTVDVPNNVVIAVSSGSTITGTTSFTFFKFRHDLPPPSPSPDTNGFADYPSLGVDAKALYIGVNMFNHSLTSYLGTTGFVVRKSSLLSGGPIVVTAFRQLATASGAGPYSPRGVDNNNPNATQGYFIGVDNAAFGLLDVRRVRDPGGIPRISGNLKITVPTTFFPILVDAKGSNHPLDSLDDRLFAAAIHVNTLTGVRTLCTAHNIQVNSSGVASTSGGRNGSRWYLIGNLGGTPTLKQEGTLFDSASSDPRNFWIPSCALSGQGHMALGASVAGATEFAEIATSGRLASDPAGTLRAPTTAQTSATSYNVQDSTPQRWGDYSYVSVDPNDDMTMWTVQEYCDATDSWGVRAIQLKAPGPATPASASPSSVLAGSNDVAVVITGTSSAGSGFFDPGSGFSKHIKALVKGGGVTVNSITFTDPTHIEINISVAADATPGARVVKVTNPDGQSAASATGILTID